MLSKQLRCAGLLFRGLIVLNKFETERGHVLSSWADHENTAIQHSIACVYAARDACGSPNTLLCRCSMVSVLRFQPWWDMHAAPSSFDPNWVMDSDNEYTMDIEIAVRAVTVVVARHVILRLAE